MLGNLLFGYNLFAISSDTFFKGSVWVEICPIVTDWEDESVNEVISSVCEENK